MNLQNHRYESELGQNLNAFIEQTDGVEQIYAKQALACMQAEIFGKSDKNFIVYSFFALSEDQKFVLLKWDYLRNEWSTLRVKTPLNAQTVETYKKYLGCSHIELCNDDNIFSVASYMHDLTGDHGAETTVMIHDITYLAVVAHTEKPFSILTKWFSLEDILNNQSGQIDLPVKRMAQKIINSNNHGVQNDK